MSKFYFVFDCENRQTSLRCGILAVTFLSKVKQNDLFCVKRIFIYFPIQPPPPRCASVNLTDYCLTTSSLTCARKPKHAALSCRKQSRVFSYLTDIHFSVFPAVFYFLKNSQKITLLLKQLPLLSQHTNKVRAGFVPVPTNFNGGLHVSF